MTDAINYVQSFFSLGNISSNSLGRNEIRLMRELLKEARLATQQAHAEAQNGKKAASLVGDLAKRSIVNIAIWHYETAARKYRQAAEWLEQARRLSHNSKREILIKNEAKEVSKQAMEAERAVKALNALMTKGYIPPSLKQTARRPRLSVAAAFSTFMG